MNLSSRKNSLKKSNMFVDYVNEKKTLGDKKSSGSQKKKWFNFKKKDNSLKGKKKHPLLKKVAVGFSLFILFSVLIGILFLIGIVTVFSQKLPNIDEEFAQSNNEGRETVITDRNGKELYRLQGDVVKDRVYISEVPDKLKWSFIAAEDAEFYNHKGLNIWGLGRAFVCTVKGSDCGGGSSITQQVIKNTTDLKQRTYQRKLQEAVLAMKTEQEYTKDQILELYINAIPMGGNYEGVKTASKYMYDQEDLSKLTLAQMAYLAAIPNEPAYLSPLSGSTFDQERSQARAEYVLDRMYDLRDQTKVTQDEIKQAKEELPTVVFKKKKIDMKAPHYVEYVLKQLDVMYADKVPEKKQGREYVRGKGYTIVTAVDLDTQEMLEEHIKSTLNDPKNQFNIKIGAQTAAAVMMDPRTGEVMAMVGSKDFYGEVTQGDLRYSPETNEATAPHSLGSTIKPFVYLSAFTQGYNPSMVLPDFKLDMQAPGSPSKYSVSDYGDSQLGYENDPYTKGREFITARTALKWSLNIPAVATYYYANYPKGQSGGYQPVTEDVYVKLTGNQEFKNGPFQYPSSAIGGFETSLLDQVHAYATLGSEGIYRPEKVILEIKDETGNVVENFRKIDGKQVIDKKYTYLINDMNKRYWLFEKDPLLKKLNTKMDFGGKTGTADNANAKTSDTAFVGYSPTFVLGMWAGNTKRSIPINDKASGESLYNTLYKPFLEKYESKIEPAKYYKDGVMATGVTKEEVCNLTGKQKSDLCTAGTHFEIVGDKPMKEDMLVNVSITQCGDTEKLARQIDKDYGLSQDKTYLSYKFPIKHIEDQITNRKSNAVPKEECTLERNANPPVVKIDAPTDETYDEGDTMPVKLTITGDIPIKEVEIWINSTFIQKLTVAPYETTIKLSDVQLNSSDSKGLKAGNYILQVVARDMRNNSAGETRAQTGFKVKSNNGGFFPFKFTPTPSPVVLEISPTSFRRKS